MNVGWLVCYIRFNTSITHVVIAEGDYGLLPHLRSSWFDRGGFGSSGSVNIFVTFQIFLDGQLFLRRSWVIDLVGGLHWRRSDHYLRKTIGCEGTCPLHVSGRS